MLKQGDSIIKPTIRERMRIETLAIKLGIKVSDVFIKKRDEYPDVMFFKNMIMGASDVYSATRSGAPEDTKSQYSLLTIKEFINKMKNKA